MKTKYNSQTSQTVAFLNQRTYEELLDSDSELIKVIRADIKAGMSPGAVKALVSDLYAGTKPAELRTIIQVAQHIAAGGE